MTNHWTDIGNASLVFVIGANPSENHPACMAHVNRARFDGLGRGRKAKLIVVDPRKTRTALQADLHVRIRPGTDIAFMNGLMNYILNNAGSVDAGAAANMLAWHDGTAANSTSIARAFLDDGGASHTLDGTQFAAVTYDNVATTAFSATRGWPKYTDARMKLNTATGDYVRGVMRTASTSGTAYTFTNMPVVSANLTDSDTVYSRLKEHVAPYDLPTTADICGCTEAEIIEIATEFIANSRFKSSDFGAAAMTPNDPGYKATTLLYAMGGTQHTCGSQNIRAYAVLQTFMGNMGRAGGGINALRGIHNVQGSTDMGLLFDSIIGYSGNPSTYQTYGDYLNKLYGNRIIATAGTKASLTVDCTNANSDLKFTGKMVGVAYNAVTVAYLDPNAAGAAIAVNVTGNDIVVSLATDAGSLVKSTATQVKAAIDASAAASNLVDVANATGNTGAGVVEAKAAAALTGGVDDVDTAAYATMAGLQQRGFFNMTREWFADTTVTARADVDKLWALWPKGNGFNHIEAFRRMGLSDGSVTAADPNRIKACYIMGQNPAVTEPNQSEVRKGLENLDLLVVQDMFATETAECKRKPAGVTYLLPSCSYVEEAGSVTNSGRWMQWRERATAPKGNSKADLEWLLRLTKALNDNPVVDGGSAFKHIKDTWATMNGVPTLYNSGAGADPFTVLYAKYGWDGVVPFEGAASGAYVGLTATTADGIAVRGSEVVAEEIYKEICRPLNDNVDGTKGGTMWIYSGNLGLSGYSTSKTDIQPAIGVAWDFVNRSRNRKGTPDYAGPALTYPRWGWAWLLNRRVFYNNGESALLAPVGGGTATKWDVDDTFVAPGLVARLYTINTNTLANWSSAYRAYNTLSDMPSAGTGVGGPHKYPGRFPAHTEPYESPRPLLQAAYGVNTSAGKSLLGGVSNGIVPSGSQTLLGTVDGSASKVPGAAADGIAYPLVLTTIRCVEHFQGGPVTRNNPWNVEAEPEPWVEINSIDARNAGIKDGDWVNIITARSDSQGDQVGRTLAEASTAPGVKNFGKGWKARVQVGLQSNQRVAQGVVAIPWHWGDRGLSTGARANDLCIDASDANTMIPEYKACLCKIVPAT